MPTLISLFVVVKDVAVAALELDEVAVVEGLPPQALRQMLPAAAAVA
jgi:hypothetical protein